MLVLLLVENFFLIDKMFFVLLLQHRNIVLGYFSIPLLAEMAQPLVP